MSWERTGVALGALLVACSSRVDVASHGQDVSNDGGGSGGAGAGGSTGGDGAGAAGATDVGGDGTGAAGATGFGTGSAPGGGGFGAGGSTDTGGFGTGSAGSTDVGGAGSAGSTDTGGFGGTGSAPGAGGSTDVGGATGSIGGATQIALSDGGILTCVAATPGITSLGANGYRVVVLDVKDQSDGGLPESRVGIENWRIALNDERGNPVTNASFSVKPFMPLMGHGAPLVPDVSGGEQGIYDVSNLGFVMPGFWTVDLSLTRGGSFVDTIRFAVCIPGVD